MLMRLLLTCLLISMPSVCSAQVIFEWLTVDNPGNAADDTLRTGGTSGYGSVAYTYEITKVQVTNAQYLEFLIAMASKEDPHGLYAAGMRFQVQGGIIRSGELGDYTYVLKPNMGNKPVTYVHVYDAMRFANWLYNGQPVGDQDNTTTEDGVYTITQDLIDEHVIVRNDIPGIFLPTEDEWYKAAYHEPGASGNDYWSYPTRSDVLPAIASANSVGDMIAGANIANFQHGCRWGTPLHGNVTTVGSAGPLSESYYGTRDMAGSLWDWTETIIEDFPNAPASNPPSNGKWRSIMGGSWATEFDSQLESSFRHPEDPFDSDCCRGMRLVRINPEPRLLARVAMEMISGLNTLVIDGTGDDDFVEVFSDNGERITLEFDNIPGSLNSTTATFPADSQIERIRFLGRNGDDMFINNTEFDSSIFGHQGNDILRGGNGHNWIQGGDGDDQIFGGDRNDNLRGRAGNDFIVAGKRHDRVFGGPGDDVIMGGAGNDRINGDSGNDEIFAGNGNDRVKFDVGGGSDDVTFGNALGSDVAIFGAVFSDYSVFRDRDAILATNSSGQIITLKRVDVLRFDDIVIPAKDF